MVRRERAVPAPRSDAPASSLIDDPEDGAQRWAYRSGKNRAKRPLGVANSKIALCLQRHGYLNTRGEIACASLLLFARQCGYFGKGPVVQLVRTPRS